MNDSILIVPPYAGFESDSVLVTDFDAALEAKIVTPLEPVETVAEIPTWQSGLPGVARAQEIGKNSGILSIIAAVAILMLLSYGKFRRLFSSLISNLWSLRQRENAFDDHTSNEAPVLMLLAVQWSLATGLLLYARFESGADVTSVQIFTTAIGVVGVMAAYYVFQFLAYNILGYTFTEPVSGRLLVSGFTSSQALSGCLLMPAALVAIFYPQATAAMFATGLTIYVIARIAFNIKGFRIFYHNFSSLLYYILYRCTL